MSEVSEAPTPIETGSYSPQETHKKWYEKAKIAGGTVALYAGSLAHAAVASVMATETLSTRSQIDTLQEVARQMGGTISPESLQSLAVSANLSEKAAIAAGITSLLFFGSGTLSVIRSVRREK